MYNLFACFFIYLLYLSLFNEGKRNKKFALSGLHKRRYREKKLDICNTANSILESIRSSTYATALE